MIFSKTYYFKSKLEPFAIVENLGKYSSHKSQSYLNGIPINQTKTFSGIITSDSFDLRKNLPYFNSFRPRIKGNFEKVNDYTALVIKFSIKWWIVLLTMIFLLLFSIAYISFNLVFINLSVNAGSTPDYSNIRIIVIFNIIFISTIIILFQLEKHWGLKDLIKILQLEKT